MLTINEYNNFEEKLEAISLKWNFKLFVQLDIDFLALSALIR